jgi:FkbM family methyltransferase
MNLNQRLKTIRERLYRSPRPSLNDLDKKIEKYINYKYGFFIEAGANDGYSQSNTYYLEKKRGWTGILIEGIPELYQKCKSQRSKSKVFNCALVSNDFTKPTITMHYAHLMSFVDGALKTREEQHKHFKNGMDVQKLEKSYSIEVPARTLESILDEIPNFQNIDLLSLDVEGYELNALKGLNLSKYRPKYILIEAKYFSEVDSFLVAHHYTMVDQMSYHDYFYAR